MGVWVDGHTGIINFSLTPEKSWDFIVGDQCRRLLEASKLVSAIEDFEMRADETPCYTIVMKMGPLGMRSVSDYTVFERPHRTVNRVLDNPLGGQFYVDLVPVPEGTQVTERWEVDPSSPVIALLLPLLGPILRRTLQRDLDGCALAAGLP